MPALVGIALLAAACGGIGGAATTTITPPSATTTTTAETTTSIAPATTTSTAPATTTTIASTTTTAATATTTTALAGQPIEFGPALGDVLMVIGVRHDDVLNLRAGPGTNQQILDKIPPTYTNLEAQGNTRQLPASLWIEVDYEGTVGWVSLAFVGYEAETRDDTARLIDELGERPVESSMNELGELVAKAYASDGDPSSDVVQVTPVTAGDLAEVTYDVVGLGDDSVHGARVHIFAEKVADGFSLRSVEVAPICSRGVDDGLCV